MYVLRLDTLCLLVFSVVRGLHRLCSIALQIRRFVHFELRLLLIMMCLVYFSVPVANSSEDEESQLRADQLAAVLNLKHIRSLAEPGECVGLLAAQVSAQFPGFRSVLVPPYVG